MLDLKITPKRPRILYIGNADSNPGVLYLQALVQSGYDVFHVGNNSTTFNTTGLPRKPFFVKTQVGPAQVQICEFSLKSLLDMVGYDWDAIVHVQNWIYFTDTELSPIPYYFYCTEIAYPRVPRCAWHVLAATDVIKRVLKLNCRWVKTFIYHPHSVPLIQGTTIKYPRLKKTIKGSFAGELYSLPLYRDRRETVKFVQEKVEGFEAHYLGQLVKGQEKKGRLPESGKGKLDAIKYTNLLLKTRCALNVPTVGGTNFRDLEALSMGAMLVTMGTPDLYLMGIEDGINCRIFKNKEEAVEIIDNDWEPEIARKGWETVFFGRKWWQQKDLKTIQQFKYLGFIEHEDSSKNYMKFWVQDKIPSLEQLKQLKNDGTVLRYKRTDRILKIVPKSAIMIEPILLKLGFIEWHVQGHTVFHRMKELALYMNRTAGILIPGEIDQILTKLNERNPALKTEEKK